MTDAELVHQAFIAIQMAGDFLARAGEDVLCADARSLLRRATDRHHELVKRDA